jgi:hypothetical protein
VIPLPLELVPREDLKNYVMNSSIFPKIHKEMRSYKEGKLPRKIRFSIPTSIHRIIFGDDASNVIEFTNYGDLLSVFGDQYKLQMKYNIAIMSPGTKLIHHQEQETTTIFLHFKVFCITTGYLRWPILAGETEEMMVNGEIIEVPKDDEPLLIGRHDLK